MTKRCFLTASSRFKTDDSNKGHVNQLALIGFKILKEKSKILKINSSIPEPITLDGNHSRKWKILSI